MDQQLLELAANFDPSRPEMLEHPQRPFDVYDVMRATCPVKRVERQPGVTAQHGAGWVLTRYADVVDVFRDDEHFSSIGILGSADDDSIPIEQIGLDQVDPRTMARMAQKIPMFLDPPEFVAYRRLLMPLLSPKRVAIREAAIRALTSSLIDDFIENGSCDFHEQLNKPLPGILTCQLLGLPIERWRSFADPIDEFVHREGVGELKPEDDVAYEDSPFARMQVPGMMSMLAIAQARHNDPRDDIITELENSSLDGRRLSAYELGAMLSILLSGGTETTTSALGSALVYLGRNRDLRVRLSANPSLIPTFVEEVLRMWPPLMSFYRIVKEPWSIDGNPLSPGDVMYLALAAANRDPEQFADPHEFRYDRSPNRHLTFTVGIHRCLGSTLARVEMRIALEEVLRRIPDYELLEDEVELLPHFPTAYGYRRISATFSPGARQEPQSGRPTH
jgi:cytochrome P450